MISKVETEFLNDYYGILMNLAKHRVVRNPSLSYLAVNYPPRPLSKPIEYGYEGFVDNILGTMNSFFSESTSLNVYLHTPFCSRLCTFCHYNLTTKFDEDIKREYVLNLSKEIEFFSSRLKRFPKTIKLFFGGGSPSQLDPLQIEALYSQVEKSFKGKIVESTIEIHPEIVNRYADLGHFFNTLKEIGITRISVGLQTSNDKILKRCNRGHTASDAKRILETLKDFSFITNVDTLIELPGQTLGTFFDTLRFAYSSSPSMVTVYPLHLKPGSYDCIRYIKRKDNFPDWKLIAKLIILADKFADEFGYHNDLVNWYKSSDTKDGMDTELRSRWLDERSALIGFGCGAYSRIIFDYSNILYWNNYSLRNYKALISRGRLGADRFLQSGKEESIRQQLILYVKSSSLKKDYFNRLCALMEKETLNEVKYQLEKLESLNLLAENSSEIQLTKVGRVLSEEIAGCFASTHILSELKKVQEPSEIRYSFFPAADLCLRFKRYLHNL